MPGVKVPAVLVWLLCVKADAEPTIRDAIVREVLRIPLTVVSQDQRVFAATVGVVDMWPPWSFLVERYWASSRRRAPTLGRRATWDEVVTRSARGIWRKRHWWRYGHADLWRVVDTGSTVPVDPVQAASRGRGSTLAPVVRFVGAANVGRDANAGPIVITIEALPAGSVRSGGVEIISCQIARLRVFVAFIAVVDGGGWARRHMVIQRDRPGWRAVLGGSRGVKPLVAGALSQARIVVVVEGGAEGSAGGAP